MDTVPARKSGSRKRIVIGAVTAAVAVALAVGAGYWWSERDRPSQASAADCRLAQRITTEAREIASGPPADAERWARETATERRTAMKDGYLGFNVAQYEAWAVLTAQKSPEAPSAKDVRNLQGKAQQHCAQAGVTVSMPPFGS